MSVTILNGDCREILRTLADERVHCVVTSPPYWGLRDYGVAGQIGLEADFNAYIATMVEVFREVRRVLRKDGTLWLNLGDSYAGSMGGSFKSDSAWDASQDRAKANGYTPGVRARTPYQRSRMEVSGLKPKDLCGIPWRVAFALQADGWWLRQDIIWAKPNPMPESVTDRCTKSHEYLFLLSKSERYFYDAEAIREPISESTLDRWNGIPKKKRPNGLSTDTFVPGENTCGVNANGRNKRSVWEIATAPFPEAHFATFPPALIEPCIKAGTSERGCCAKCGAPWVREVERGPSHYEQLGKNVGSHFARGDIDPKNQASGGGQTRNASGSVPSLRAAATKMLGWSPSCSCVKPIGWAVPCDTVPCTVLDPFGGAGTTGLVADRLGRNAILIELNPEYAAIAEHRIKSDSPLFTSGVQRRAYYSP